MRPLFISIVLVFQQVCSIAQQTFPVTDSAPALLNGLQAGYTIKGESEKEVGNKGNFSRYKLVFYVTNTTTEAKLLFWSQRGDAIMHAANAVPEVVRFVCQNATGARFTSKECSLSASACTLEVLVEDKDATGKIVQNKRMANLGYWIRPGETISTSTIMIVPLNERPAVTAIFFPVNNTFATSVQGFAQPGYGNPPASPQYGPLIVRLRNASTGAHLDCQNGKVVCTGYDQNSQVGWGAEWELVPVAGANYFQIANKLQHKFLSVDGPGMLSDNSQSRATFWTIEQSYGSTMYSIRNALNNSTLVYRNGAVVIENNGGMQDNAGLWLVERE